MLYFEINLRFRECIDKILNPYLSPLSPTGLEIEINVVDDSPWSILIKETAQPSRSYENI